MTNKIIWFNIGQKGDHFVTWQSGMIEDTFDPKTIKFEDYYIDENGNEITKWVSKDKLSYTLHHSLKSSFDDLEQVSKWIKHNYETGEEVYVGNGNWTHIYEVFDMDNKNKWGVGKPLDFHNEGIDTSLWE